MFVLIASVLSFLMLRIVTPKYRIAEYFEQSDKNLNQRVLISHSIVRFGIECILTCHYHPRCLSASLHGKVCSTYSEDFRNLEESEVLNSPTHKLLSMNKLDCFSNRDSILFSDAIQNNCELAEKVVQPIRNKKWTEIKEETCIGNVIVARERNSTCGWPNSLVRKLKIEYLRSCEGDFLSERQKMGFETLENAQGNLTSDEARDLCRNEGLDPFTSLHWFACDGYSGPKPELDSSVWYFTGFKMDEAYFWADPLYSAGVTMVSINHPGLHWNAHFPVFMTGVATYCVTMNSEGKLQNQPCSAVPAESAAAIICDNYEAEASAAENPR